MFAILSNSQSHYTVNWSPRHSLAKTLEHKNWLQSFNDRKYLKASIRARIYVDYNHRLTENEILTK